jgi:hypothetical protein
MYVVTNGELITAPYIYMQTLQANTIGSWDEEKLYVMKRISSRNVNV